MKFLTGAVLTLVSFEAAAHEASFIHSHSMDILLVVLGLGAFYGVYRLIRSSRNPVKGE